MHCAGRSAVRRDELVAPSWAKRFGWWRCAPAIAASVATVFNIHPRVAERVIDSLDALAGFLGDDDFLGHARFLADDGLLRGFGYLDRSLLEQITGRALRNRTNRFVHGPAFDVDPLLAKTHVFMHRLFHDVGAHTDRAA